MQTFLQAFSCIMPSKHSYKLQNIQNRLEKLCCPFIEEGGEQWMAELLLHPSETRLKLLTWALCNFDSDFDEVISKSLPVINSRIDSRQQRILFVLNLLNLCKIDDIEIVKGTASQKKQLAFWDNLIDLVYTSQTGHNYLSDIQTKEQSSEETSYYLKPAQAPSLFESFQSSCTFMDTLIRENKTKSLFSTEIHLFSPDLESRINNEMKVQETPSIDLLTDTAVKISEDIALTIKQIEGSLAKFAPFDLDQNIVENYCRKVDLSLKTFSQMIDSFLHCHTHDIEVWCRKEHPNVSELGHAVHSTNNMLTGPTKLHKSLTQLNNTMSKLSQSLVGDTQELQSKHSVDLAHLTDTVNVLQASMNRLQR